LVPKPATAEEVPVEDGRDELSRDTGSGAFFVVGGRRWTGD
jgi:hypothetical protein